METHSCVGRLFDDSQSYVPLQGHPCNGVQSSERERLLILGKNRRNSLLYFSKLFFIYAFTLHSILVCALPFYVRVNKHLATP
jgi:hypothetical protein